MRFESTLPDDRVNIGEGSPAREAGLLVVGFVVIALVVTTILALSIEALIPLVPPSLEVRFFGGLAELAGEDETDEESDAEQALPSDPRKEQVQALVDRLALHWTDAPYPAFYAFVIEDPLPNAFALPGGAIGVTSGLLDRIDTENELAFILGHELGHFAGRDHLRGLGRGLAISIVWMATGLSGDQIESLASTASAFSSRHFDRDQESDADLFGVRLLVQEYGHATGPRAVFERVLIDPETEEQARGQETPRTLERLAGYLSTHPFGPDRIRVLEAFIRTSGWPSEGEERVWPRQGARENQAAPSRAMQGQKTLFPRVRRKANHSFARWAERIADAPRRVIAVVLIVAPALVTLTNRNRKRAAPDPDQYHELPSRPSIDAARDAINAR